MYVVGKSKQKTWGASLSVWTSALKKLSEDPQAAKRRIEEQAAKEEADRIAEEARYDAVYDAGIYFEGFAARRALQVLGCVSESSIRRRG